MKLRAHTILAAALWSNVSRAIATETAFEEEARAKLEAEVFAETLAAGRGDRETVGVRDQWGSSEHLNRKEDTRAGAPKLSAKVIRSASHIRCDL